MHFFQEHESLVLSNSMFCFLITHIEGTNEQTEKLSSFPKHITSPLFNRNLILLHLHLPQFFLPPSPFTQTLLLFNQTCLFMPPQQHVTGCLRISCACSIEFLDLIDACAPAIGPALLGNQLALLLGVDALQGGLKMRLVVLV